MRLSLIALAFVASPTLAQESEVSFGRFRLGMSLQEARAIPLESPDEGRTRSLFCSWDKQLLRSKPPTPEMSAGVVYCNPGDGLFSRQTLDRAFVVKMGLIEARPSFTFFNEQMVSILVTYEARDAAPVEAAMKAKFGAEPVVTIDVVQNRMGAKFDRRKLTWTLGNKVVSLQSPGTSLDNVGAYYVDTKAEAESDKAVAAEKARGIGL